MLSCPLKVVSKVGADLVGTVSIIEYTIGGSKLGTKLKCLRLSLFECGLSSVLKEGAYFGGKAGGGSSGSLEAILSFII